MPRNSSGVYTLPPSVNPVTSGTTIQSSWANTTLDDVAQAITDSLDRYGRGGMVAAFRITDGTVGLPGLAFANETTTGLSRPTAGQLSASVLATEILRITAGGLALLSGQVRVANGSVGAPSFSFSSELTTGMWLPGAGVLAWSLAGAEVARLTATGLGVNTTPATQLHGRRVGSGSGFLTEPVLRLECSGAAADVGIQFFNNGVNSQVGISEQGGVLRLGTSNTERVRLTAAGDLGVGYTPPNYGAGTVAFGVNAAAQPVIDLAIGGTRNAVFTVNASDVIFGSIANKPLILYSNNTARLTIAGTGAITQSSPGGLGYTLTSGSSTIANYMRLTNAGGDGFIGNENSAGTGLLAGGPGAYALCVGTVGATNLAFGTANTLRALIDSAGVFTYGGIEIGYRDLPTSDNSGGYTVAATNRGKAIRQTTSSTITVPNATAGWIHTIVNRSGGNLTLTGSGATLTLAGTTTTGNRTVANGGIATVYWDTATTVMVSGPGVT